MTSVTPNDMTLWLTHARIAKMGLVFHLQCYKGTNFFLLRTKQGNAVKVNVVGDSILTHPSGKIAFSVCFLYICSGGKIFI